MSKGGDGFNTLRSTNRRRKFRLWMCSLKHEHMKLMLFMEISIRSLYSSYSSLCRLQAASEPKQHILLNGQFFFLATGLKLWRSLTSQSHERGWQLLLTMTQTDEVKNPLYLGPFQIPFNQCNNTDARHRLTLPISMACWFSLFRMVPVCCSGSLGGLVWGWRAAAVAVWPQQFSVWGRRARWDSYSHTELCEEACGSQRKTFKCTAGNKCVKIQVVCVWLSYLCLRKWLFL